jgi:hypothetical protein
LFVIAWGDRALEIIEASILFKGCDEATPKYFGDDGIYNQAITEVQS